MWCEVGIFVTCKEGGEGGTWINLAFSIPFLFICQSQESMSFFFQGNEK